MFRPPSTLHIDSCTYKYCVSVTLINHVGITSAHFNHRYRINTCQTDDPRHCLLHLLQLASQVWKRDKGVNPLAELKKVDVKFSASLIKKIHVKFSCNISKIIYWHEKNDLLWKRGNPRHRKGQFDIIRSVATYIYRLLSIMKLHLTDINYCV